MTAKSFVKINTKINENIDAKSQIVASHGPRIFYAISLSVRSWGVHFFPNDLMSWRCIGSVVIYIQWIFDNSRVQPTVLDSRQLAGRWNRQSSFCMWNSIPWVGNSSMQKCWQKWWQWRGWQGYQRICTAFLSSIAVFRNFSKLKSTPKIRLFHHPDVQCNWSVRGKSMKFISTWVVDQFVL